VSADGLASIAPEEWDRLVGPGSVPLKHGFLRAWERCELPGLRSRPVLAGRPGERRPVGACPGYLYDLDIPTVRLPQLAPVLMPVRRLWPRFGFARTYEVGSPTPLVNPFLVSDERLRERAVPAMVEAALTEAEERGTQLLLVQNFTGCRGPAAEALSRHDCVPVVAPPTAVLPLPFESFDGYLGAMRAQYRRRAQKTFERSQHLTIEHLETFHELAGELARLWRCIYDRAHEVRREILPPAFFAAVSAVPEASVLLTRRPDRSIASFALLIDDAPWLSFVQCGFETDAGRDEGAYFRLLYELVRLAVERGYEQLDLGITTLNPKLDVGAVPVPLWAWLRHRHAPVQAVIRQAVQRFMELPDLAPRRVFKELPATAEEIVAARRLVA
jgi:predicted N-acyltransferase